MNAYKTQEVEGLDIFASHWVAGFWKEVQYWTDREVIDNFEKGLIKYSEAMGVVLDEEDLNEALSCLFTECERLDILLF